MNPGLRRFSGRATVPDIEANRPGTAGGFTRRERDKVVTEDSRDRVHTDYARDQYERSHPDALFEAAIPEDPADLLSFTRDIRSPGLRRGVTDPRKLPSWLPPAKMVDPSSEFEERVKQIARDLSLSEGRRLNEERKQREYQEKWRPRRWNDFIDRKGSTNPGLSRFGEIELGGESVPVQRGPETPEPDWVGRSRRQAILNEHNDDPVARHRRGQWTHRELMEREEQIQRSRARRGPDAPPTREEERQNARLLRLFRGSQLYQTPWAEHTDQDTGVRTYTNKDSAGVTHGISVPLGDEGHYVHETLVTKPEHYRTLNEALLNAMMLEQYLQSQSQQKNQDVQQALAPLIH